MLKIYKASAGSGKTYTLAYEYIKTLLGVKVQGKDQYVLNSPKYNKGFGASSNRHKYILAITFTNKATEEMKRRIIEKLDALSRIPAPGTKDADYAGELCGAFGCTRAELAEVAGKALRQLLNFYGAFNVATIDSFFQRVLRTFARELDRQGDFSVELNDKFAVQTAVNAMLDDFNRNGDVHNPLGRWIVRYIGHQLDSGGKTNFFNRKSQLHTTLVGILTNICEETFKPYEKAMKEYLDIDSPDGGNLHKVEALLKSLRQTRVDILEEIKYHVESVISYLAAKEVTLDQLNGKLSLRRYIETYFITGKECTDKEIDNATLVKVAAGEKDPFTKKFRGTEDDKSVFAEMLRRVRTRYYDYFAIGQIERGVDSFALLAFAWRYLRDFSTDNNTVLLSDTGNILSRIIGKEDTPFIYERMGVSLRNFLIDEFQDTSRMQWTNLMPLVRSGLSEGHDSLIIGDEKQSIYRFRNSDSSLLHTEVETVDFPRAAYGTTVHGTDTSENTNWRSAADIVLFNNTLFTNLARILHVDGFGNVCQAIAPKHLHHSGYVEFVPVTEKAAVDAMDDSGDSDMSSDKIRKLYAVDLMAAKMLHQHDVLGYRWKDMAVLVNTNKEGATVINRLMASHPGIPVMSEESLYVKKSPAVQLVTGVLKIMASPDTAGVPKGGFPTPSQLARILNRFEYFRNMGLTVDEALDKAMEADDADSLSVGIDAIKKRKPSSLPALVETIIHEQIPPGERRSQVAYLTAFLDYVTDYCSSHNPTLSAFLNAWDIAKDNLSVSSASDIDAVRVMTIHKSKGLEFDCVHIPFGSWELISRPRGQWIPFPDIPGVDKDLCPPAIHLALDKYFSMEGSMLFDEYRRDQKELLEDTMNKTYVAYTRASEQLIVYYDNCDGIGEAISDAMRAGYDGTDPYLTDISRFYASEGAFVMGTVLTKEEAMHAAGKKDAGEDEDGKSREVMHLDEYKVTYNDDAQVLTRVADIFDFTPDAEEEDGEDAAAATDVYPDEEARQRGIMLHDVLSRIDSVDDIGRAVGEYGALMGFTSAEKEELLQTVKGMFAHDDGHLRRWFTDNERVLNEQAIYDSRWDKKRRIDRLVFLPDGSVEVVDYKFTSEPSPHHLRQVGGYMGLLRRMGYGRVRGYLWYPFLGQIVEVKQSR